MVASSASSTPNGPTSVRRSDTQWPPSAVGDRAHVGSGRDEQVEPGDSAFVRLERELVDVHRAKRHLDGNASPVQGVGALAADLHRRDGGNRQLDGAAERGERLVERFRAERLVLVEHVALEVAGRRAGRQVDRGRVPLRQAYELRLQPRRGAREEHEQAGREGIERARVPGAGARPPPDRRDDRERRRAGRLVDEDDPARMLRARRHVGEAQGQTRGV